MIDLNYIVGVFEAIGKFQYLNLRYPKVLVFFRTRDKQFALNIKNYLKMGRVIKRRSTKRYWYFVIGHKIDLKQFLEMIYPKLNTSKPIVEYILKNYAWDYFVRTENFSLKQFYTPAMKRMRTTRKQNIPFVPEGPLDDSNIKKD